ncbi:TPA: terminase, partial [Escherichia coli O146]
SFCSPPMIVYDIEPVTGAKTKAQSLREGNKNELQRTLMNYLLVWELPDPDEEYVCGADTAEGLEHGDRSSLDVVKRSNGEQVAHWFGHLDAELFAHLISQVCRMYNNAF